MSGVSIELLYSKNSKLNNYILQQIQKYNISNISGIDYDDVKQKGIVNDIIPKEVTVIPALMMWKSGKLVALYESTDIINVINKIYGLSIEIPNFIIGYIPPKDDIKKNLTKQEQGEINTSATNCLLKRLPVKKQIHYQTFQGLDKITNDRVNTCLMAKQNIRGVIHGAQNSEVINLIKKLPVSLEEHTIIPQDSKVTK